MSESLGMDCKLFFNSVELDNAQNVDVSDERAETDVTKRANDGLRAKRTTLREVSITWEMIYNAADSQFSSVQTAYEANDEVTVRVEDDGGTTLLEATGYVKGFSVSQPLEEASKVNVTFVPSAIL